MDIVACAPIGVGGANDCLGARLAPDQARHRKRVSVVIPAFNEARRLPPYLDSIREYCSKVFGEFYEVIVVDDGGTDGIFHEYLAPLASQWKQLVVIRHRMNQGKGAAVRTGILSSSGDYILFADADGSTPIGEEAKLRLAIEGGKDIAVGSRIGSGEVRATRITVTRSLAAWAFEKLVQIYTQLPIRDTQCGFKMFRRGVAIDIFSVCFERGYLFDVFVLRFAVLRGYSIDDVEVDWHDVPGSKVRAVRDSLSMWYGLHRINRNMSRVCPRVK